MTTLNISLPKSMKGFVESQIKARGYATASEYVRDLIRDAQKQAAQQRLEQLILDGINSGDPIPVNEEFWRVRREKLARSVQRKKRRK